MLAAGLEYSDEQLTRSVSPGRYRNNIPSIVGLFSGISVQINDGKNVKKGLHEFGWHLITNLILWGFCCGIDFNEMFELD
jgi:hypothetical protein